jgi:peptidoglycan/xylan/chitin deacetylase (PgdA/CDA1 family)
MNPRKVLLSLAGFVTAYGLTLALPSIWPAVQGLSGDSARERFHRVPILCFHNLNGSGRYSISSATFRHFMRRLKEEKISVISLSELAARSRKNQLLDRPAIVITVDDDYEGAVRIAAPILREYEYPATFFVYTAGIQDDPQSGMSWEDLRRLLKEGFDIQNHSHTHTAFHTPKPGEDEWAYSRRLDIEVDLSRKILEEQLMGHKITQFAYPMGYHSPRLRDRVFQSRYELVVTTDGRPVDLTRPFTGSFDRRTIELEGGVAEQIFAQAMEIAKKPL